MSESTLLWRDQVNDTRIKVKTLSRWGIEDMMDILYFESVENRIPVRVFNMMYRLCILELSTRPYGD